MVRLAKGKEAAEVIRRLFGVRAEYLEATWATIEEEYGSFTNFTAQGLGLDAQDIEQLREYYLE
jgi:protein-tyrosine phosphatase